MDRKKAKESLSKLLAASAGSLLVASGVAPEAAQAAVPADHSPVPVLERADEVRAKLAAPVLETENAEAPVQLAWWGNWHNGGWHPYWHNWPNWRNWHNWGNW